MGCHCLLLIASIGDTFDFYMLILCFVTLFNSFIICRKCCLGDSLGFSTVLSPANGSSFISIFHPGGLSGGSDSKEATCVAGDPSSIPGSRRSPGVGNGNPLQYTCLENPMDGEAWWATVHGVAKNQIRLSDSHFLIEESEGLSVFCQQS